MSAARSSRRRRRRRLPPGTAPGTLVADPDASPSRIRVIRYGPERVEEHEVKTVDEVRAMAGRDPVMWINVDGLGDTAAIGQLGELFGLHKLALEDVVNLSQRAKVEIYPNHLYIVARMIHYDGQVQSEQLSILLGKDFVLTFQEQPGDMFDPVRERIRGGRGRMRHAGPGYLAYALLDAVIDNYFPVLETFGERLEQLEDEILERPTRKAMASVHDTKRDLLALRRSIWPMRETLNTLLREQIDYFGVEDRPYLQDCYDHTIQVMDIVETHRELGSGLLDVYLSSLGNRTNEIMKVLTMFASIFIPLSFIAGLYGMNFDTEVSRWNMPELHWVWGYFFALGLMAAVAAGLLYYFIRNGWIGRRDD